MSPCPITVFWEKTVLMFNFLLAMKDYRKNNFLMEYIEERTLTFFFSLIPITIEKWLLDIRPKNSDYYKIYYREDIGI